MGRFLRTLMLIALIGGAFYMWREPARMVALQAYREVAPCTLPISYSIEHVDARFGISTSTLATSLEHASLIWQRGAGKPLFSYAPLGGEIRVRLEYDVRQQTTEQLKDIGVIVEDTLESYEVIKARYVTEFASYARARRAFEGRYGAYLRAVDAYESEVRRWNENGGAPAPAYAQLEARKRELQAEETELAALQGRVNAMADDVNALVVTLNRLASELNINVSAYNKVGETTGGEFEEAVFESRPGRQTITIYEFDSQTSLTRVMAHEFGHALGLDHVDDSSAIMYRLNESDSLELTAADESALRTHCRFGV